MVDLVRKNANANGSGELTDTTQTIAGDKTFSGNITASNVAQTAFATTTSFSGATGTITVFASRTGDTVTLSLKFSLTKDGVTGVPTSDAVPVGFRPSARTWFVVINQINSTAGANGMRIDSNGRIGWYSNSTLSNVPAAATVTTPGGGTEFCCVSYQASAT